MAFNVIFHTFSKKERSTAVPASGGKTVSCTANEPVDLLAPVISLDWRNETGDPIGYNYAYIQAFGRYYHITGWTHQDGLWWAALRVDPLASWKASIGSQQLYVYRSAYEFDRNLRDGLYPTESRRQTVDTPLPKPWTIGGANVHNMAAGSGWFIVGLIGKDGTTYHAFSPDQLNTLLTCMFSDDYYEAVLGEFGATEYPEAKVAVNPMQYISSIKFFPGTVDTGSAASWGLEYVDMVFGVNIGPVTVPYLTQPVTSYRLSTGTAPTANRITTYNISLTDGIRHPQAAARGGWLDFSPYTVIELFYPPFGLIPIDPADIANATNLIVRLSIDARTLIATLELEAYSNSTNHRILLRAEACVGVDVPLTNIIQPGTSFMQIAGSVLGSIGGAISSFIGGDNVGGGLNVLGGIMGAAKTAVYGNIPHLSMTGGAGNTAAMAGTPTLYVTHYYVAADDNADKGRPLYAIRTLSNVPGFIMADSDAVSISCTEEELNEIRDAIRHGFYYE